jgi:hypothetical protein
MQALEAQEKSAGLLTPLGAERCAEGTETRSGAVNGPKLGSCVVGRGLLYSGLRRAESGLGRGVKTKHCVER